MISTLMTFLSYTWEIIYKKIKARMAIILMTAGGILLLSGIIIALITQSLKPIYVIAITSSIAGAIVIIGGVATLFKEIGSSKKQDKIVEASISTKETVNQLQLQNRDLLSKTDKQYEVIDRLRHENADLYSKLATQTSEHYKFSTGYESYAYVDIIVVKPNRPIENGASHMAPIIIHQVGKYPLNLIEFIVINTDNFAENMAKKAPERTQYINRDMDKLNQSIFRVEGVTVGTERQIGEIPISMKSEKRYNIRFRSPQNGEWFQRIVLRETSEDYVYSYAMQLFKVLDDGMEKIILEGSRLVLEDDKFGSETLTIASDFNTGQTQVVKPNGRWTDFPLAKGEETPFTPNKLVRLVGTFDYPALSVGSHVVYLPQTKDK